MEPKLLQATREVAQRNSSGLRIQHSEWRPDLRFLVMFIGLQLISLWSAVLSTPEMSGHNNVIAGSVKFTVLWFGKNTD